MDSTNEIVGGSHWPLVKQVRMSPRRWQVLKTGAVLVDAPCVRDDNPIPDRATGDFIPMWTVVPLSSDSCHGHLQAARS